LKTFTPKDQRIKSCADVLIYSNIIMIAINVVAINLSPFIGLTLSILCLAIGMVCIWVLPIEAGKDRRLESENHRCRDINKPLILLCLFVFVITINSGLMYQVINPAFEHLTGLTSWYWAVPYIIALFIMRNLPTRVNRAKILYVGMAMIVGAFISFMLLERNASDYLVVDTLMLGACGIFDLFWWSIIGEMLEYTENPAKILGIGLSANVLGVLSGGALGMTITSIKLPSANVAVIALTVVCVTLIILPPLNQQLLILLKNHTYLAAYDRMSENQQTNIILGMKTLEELTVREQEVLEHILAGESNREIARALSISENTVKTHVRNIFSKYEVGSRAELISTLFRNQIASS
jgi:DNA-binding CsgD family transcriptional regulator